jgi:hypothetical protein
MCLGHQKAYNYIKYLRMQVSIQKYAKSQMPLEMLHWNVIHDLANVWTTWTGFCVELVEGLKQLWGRRNQRIVKVSEKGECV